MVTNLELEAKIRAAREAYLPEQVRCILIAEAPPDSIERFFYYPDVKEADYLFLGVMEVLYPEEKQAYIGMERPKQKKELLLRRFQRDGFYLLDILDIPKKRYQKELASAVPKLIERLRAVADTNTPIILIKATTYDAAATQLSQAGLAKVIPVRIPFPSSGQQANFRNEFTRALQKV